MGALVTADPMDVVYTWVNGSDPRWQRKKDLWVKKRLEEALANGSEVSVNSTAYNSTRFATIYGSSIAAVSNSSSDFGLNNSHITGPTESGYVAGVALSSNSNYSSYSNHSNYSSSSNFNSTSELSTVEEEEEDDAMSNNRYRDSNELRYSLRSLVKYAPWVRHIYIVTDNQIPSWLNLETDRLTVITHEEIFLNKSHLPVFSSPAIETHLHRIPGLSKKFIYFNDDVFLGAPVLPEDFVHMNGAQRLYTAWEVPKCAPGCSDSWIGDGYCDKACNVAACNFDYPDCVNGTSNSRGYGSNSVSGKYTAQCAKGCPDSWLGDKVCDLRCKDEGCAWDAGDCGIEQIRDNFPGGELSVHNTKLEINGFDSCKLSRSPWIVDKYNESAEASTIEIPLYASHKPLDLEVVTNNSAKSESRNSTLNEKNQTTTLGSSLAALFVPYGTKAVYFDLSYIPCQFLYNSSSCSGIRTIKHAFNYILAEHDDSEQQVVHFSIVLAKHNSLVVLLYHGQEDAPTAPESYPFKVSIQVTATSTFTGESIRGSFELVVTDPSLERRKDSYLATRLAPPNMELIEDSFGAMLTTEESVNVGNSTDIGTKSLFRTALSAKLLSVPFSTLQHSYLDAGKIVDYEHVLQGSVIEVGFNLSADDALFLTNDQSSCKILTLSSIVTLMNGTQFVSEVPLCSALVQYQTANNCSHFARIERKNASFTSMAGSLLRSTEFKVERSPSAKATGLILRPNLLPSKMLFLHLFGQMPIYLADLPRQWLHQRLEVRLYKSFPMGLDRLQKNSKWRNLNLSRSELNCTLSNSSAVEPLSSSHFKNSSEYQRIFSSVHVLIWGVNSTFSSVGHNATISKNQLNATMNTNSTIEKSDGLDFSDSIEDLLHYRQMEDGDEIFYGESMDYTHSTGLDDDYHRGYTYDYPPNRRLTVNDVITGNYIANALQIGGNLFRWISFINLNFFDSKEEVNRRKLSDTYAASLINVNRIFNKDFGMETRKVPAHMPHTIDRDVVQELQDRYPSQWNTTSSNRFRSEKDMQFSFSYYYYLMNRYKAKPPDLEKVLSEMVDMDRDGYINRNEFRTLASLVKSTGTPSISEIADLISCIANSSSTYTHQYEEVVRHHTPVGEVDSSYTLYVYPTIKEALSCSYIVEKLRANIDWTLRYPTHILGSDRDTVAFEMIGDNYTETLHKLDSIRARQWKFVCVNDNMKNPTDDLVRALEDFYLSFFPYPSIFELPTGVRNPTLYLDEYRSMHRSGLKIISIKRSVSQMLYDGIFWIRKMILILAYMTIDAMGVENETSEKDGYIHSLRAGVRQSPNDRYRSKHSNSNVGLLASLVVFVSVLTILVFNLLRYLSRKTGNGN